MLRTVQFNDQPGLGTVKINNKGFDDPLFIDLYRIIA